MGVAGPIWHQRPTCRGGKVLGPDWAPKYVTLSDATDSDIRQLVVPLQKLRSLHKLEVSGTAVTKDGLKCLKLVSRLRVLDLRETAIDDEDIVEIRQEL